MLKAPLWSTLSIILQIAFSIQYLVEIFGLFLEQQAYINQAGIHPEAYELFFT